MTESEYKERMRELGWTEAFIQESIKLHNEAKAQGIVLPYEIDLIKGPTGYPCGVQK